MKYIEIQGLIQNTPDWFNWRKTGIGGSDCAVVMSGDFFGRTLATLWLEKMGLGESSFTKVPNEHIQRGVRLEPLARQEFIKRTGIYVSPVCMQSATHPFMLASLDGMNQERTIGCEIKAPAEKAFTQMLNTGAPQYYVDQIQHQIFVSGADEFYFWAFNPDVEPYVYLERHEPDYGRIQEILHKSSLFWRHVELGIPPSSELGVEKSKIGAMGLTLYAGYATSGKDTIGAIHRRLFGSHRYAFADALKAFYMLASGVKLTDENKAKHRQALISLGQGLRDLNPNGWVDLLFNPLSGIFESMKQDGAMITDTRYLNEASAGKRHAARLGVPCRLIFVQRPGVGPAHHTEAESTSLLCQIADVIFQNDADVSTEIGKVATEMALLAAMNVVPGGKTVFVWASDYLHKAAEVLNEAKGKRNSKTSGRKSRK